MSAPTASKNNIQTLIDQTLIDFFDESIARASTIDGRYKKLWENLASLHASGGKRIRPKIVFMSYVAFGGTDIESIAPIACAQELIHFSMLIHDDVIDRDTVRYGVDNINGKYEKIYTPYVTNSADRTHYANSAAILAGDLMIAAAHKLINDSTVSNAHKIIAQSTMYDSIFDVAGGELLDTESSILPSGSIDPLKITHYKTASYSFVGPLLTGAILAGATNAQQSILRDLAIYVGIAFQLTDDLLGVFGDEDKTGKSSTGDIREGKITYLIQQTMSMLDQKEQEQFTRFFGNQNATHDEIAKIKNIIISSSAKRVTEQKIDEYVRKSKELLQKLELPEPSHAQFEELITNATKRDF